MERCPLHNYTYATEACPVNRLPTRFLQADKLPYIYLQSPGPLECLSWCRLYNPHERFELVDIRQNVEEKQEREESRNLMPCHHRHPCDLLPWPQYRLQT